MTLPRVDNSEDDQNVSSCRYSRGCNKRSCHTIAHIGVSSQEQKNGEAFAKTRGAPRRGFYVPSFLFCKIIILVLWIG